MTDPLQLLTALRARGVRRALVFTAQGMELDVSGALTDADRAALAAHREGLLQLLLQEARAEAARRDDDAAAVEREVDFTPSPIEQWNARKETEPMSKTIPVISLWQPWASLWAHGHKQIETRSWPPSLPLPVVLAVHAAKKWDRELSSLCLTPHFRDALDVIAPGAIWDAGVCPLPAGSVVGLVRVTYSLRTDWLVTGQAQESLPLVGKLSEQERAFGDYSAGRFGWLTDRRCVLAKPIPLVGRQSVFQWAAPPDVLALAEEMTK
jgi:activating signal cointegrator 1